MVGIISVVIGGHFGGGDHFDGGDHFGGGTYVGYTCRHLHQRIEEHKGSAIGNHLREQHDIEPEDIAQSFRILRKCQNKFDCLIFEMFFIQELKPTLNKQCDSIRAKLFV